MFNDVLSIEDCKALVRNLASCVFPFMCAHGRPSMVPLIDLGERGEFPGGLGARDGSVDDADFVGAWKKWRK